MRNKRYRTVQARLDTCPSVRVFEQVAPDKYKCTCCGMIYERSRLRDITTLEANE